MTALIIAEHDNAAIKGATLNTVTAAAQFGGEVHVLVAGQRQRSSRRCGADCRRDQSPARRQSGPGPWPGRKHGGADSGPRLELQPHPVCRHRFGDSDIVDRIFRRNMTHFSSVI